MRAQPVPLPGNRISVDVEDLVLLLALSREAVESVRRAGHRLPPPVLRALAAMDGAAAAAMSDCGRDSDADGGSPSGSMLTVKAVAEAMQVSERHVRRLCESGLLPATRHGRSWVIDRDLFTIRRAA